MEETMQTASYAKAEALEKTRYSDLKKLHSLLLNAICSEEILGFYKANKSWFNAARLRRLVWHTSDRNDHITIPEDALYEYAVRLISMEEAFLLWFKHLSDGEKRFICLVTEFPAVSEEAAYKKAGFTQSEIKKDIKEKGKYVLENIAVYENGLVFCPDIIRRYIASHLSTLPEYEYLRKTLSPRRITAEDFKEIHSEMRQREMIKARFSALENELSKCRELDIETLKKAQSIEEALETAFLCGSEFEARILLPQLHLNAGRWVSPENAGGRKRYAEQAAAFLKSAVFSSPVSFADILSFPYESISAGGETMESSIPESTVLKCSIPELFKGITFYGYYVNYLPDGEKTETEAKLRSSAVFGRRKALEYSKMQLFNFVSLPAFNNLALLLCYLGFFECAFQSTEPSGFFNSGIFNSGLEKVSGLSLYSFGCIDYIKRVR